MATNRNAVPPARPQRPHLTSARTTERSPLTPRLAVHHTVSAQAVVTRRVLNATPRADITYDASHYDDGFDSDNITPRSAKRRSRVESTNNTPTQSNTPDTFRSHTGSPHILSANAQRGVVGASKIDTTKSPASELATMQAFSPFVRSPAGSEVGSRINGDDLEGRFLHASDVGKNEPERGRLDVRKQAAPQTDNRIKGDSLDSRFFHASDVGKTELETKKPEVKKPAAFFYADGQQDRSAVSSTRNSSPTRSEKRLSSQWQRLSSEPPVMPASTRSPAALSPTLSAISSSSPFFAPVARPANHKPRSGSPPKENIHLSYRKGVSQIFGSRASPIPNTHAVHDSLPEKRPGFQRAAASHRKSPSLSSIDSGLSHNSRRRTDGPSSSPLREDEDASSPNARAFPQSPPMFPIIETSLDLPSPEHKDGTMSPPRSISELASDARRERKVLDLEISNSSLLAINASLEREIRRQKTELKRFRRLSRAGRFSSAPLDGDRSSFGTMSEALDGLDDELAEFGPASGLSGLYEDMSDSEGEGSLTSAGTDVRQDRLAKDDQRLRADLDKHRDLLVQSQMMNQSIRRCTYATEEMIQDGKKALEYTVRVSDIKLGGRVLSGLEDEDEDGHPARQIEVDDDNEIELASPTSPPNIEDDTQGFMELWGGVGRIATDKSSEAGRSSLGEVARGDRDSGIEVDALVST